MGSLACDGTGRVLVATRTKIGIHLEVSRHPGRQAGYERRDTEYSREFLSKPHCGFHRCSTYNPSERYNPYRPATPQVFKCELTELPVRLGMLCGLGCRDHRSGRELR